MAGKKKKQQLKVVFDTNVIVTESVAELIRSEVAKLIADRSAHADLDVTWHLPEVVIREREYQMQQAGRELLPSITKTERLLGHNLNITEDVLDDRVRHVIEKALETNRLVRLNLDPARVDWPMMVTNAVFRRPPFEGGKKEKGFRDAIILETLLQLIDDSPQSASTCLVVLVSGDKNLAEAAKGRTTGRATVRIIPNLEELIGLINTLVSEVGEDVVQDIRGRATPYFFVEDDDTTLFFREKVLEKIEHHFAKQLAELAPGADSQALVLTSVQNPDFREKIGRRYHWLSHVRFTYQPYRLVDINAPSGGLTGWPGWQGAAGTSGYPGILDASGYPVTTGTSGYSTVPVPSGFITLPGTPGYPPYPTASTTSGYPIATGTSAYTVVTGTSANPVTISASSYPSTGTMGLLSLRSEQLPKVEKVVEVEWSVAVDTRKRFSSGRIEGIRFAGVLRRNLD